MACDRSIVAELSACGSGVVAQETPWVETTGGTATGTEAWPPGGERGSRGAHAGAAREARLDRNLAKVLVGADVQMLEAYSKARAIL